ncbi:MAG: L-threonylcarbamoyladenylate synthase [Pseudomonadota bacterium]
MDGRDQTERLSADRAGIARAADLLAEGGLVAFPTETVYGLGGDATGGLSVARIFEAKGRPSFNPLIVHVPDLATAETLIDLGPPLRRLAETFWPGPLTLVAPIRAEAEIADLVTAGLPTLAVRVPLHPVAQALLTTVERPIAAPSANPSGRISPTTADHVLDGLSGRIAAVLDAGPCDVGLESTIIGAGEDRPVLLRPGGLALEEIEAVLGAELAARGADITAPGQLSSHYAPGATLRLNAAAPESGEAWLGFGSEPVLGTPCLDLSPSRDLTEAAANLFAYLRRLDDQSARIAVAPIPETGLGAAINDRLHRAAAPRS